MFEKESVQNVKCPNHFSVTVTNILSHSGLKEVPSQQPREHFGGLKPLAEKNSKIMFSGQSPHWNNEHHSLPPRMLSSLFKLTQSIPAPISIPDSSHKREIWKDKSEGKISKTQFSGSYGLIPERPPLFCKNCQSKEKKIREQLHILQAVQEENKELRIRLEKCEFRIGHPFSVASGSYPQPENPFPIYVEEMRKLERENSRLSERLRAIQHEVMLSSQKNKLLKGSLSLVSLQQPEAPKGIKVTVERHSAIHTIEKLKSCLKDLFGSFKKLSTLMNSKEFLNSLSEFPDTFEADYLMDESNIEDEESDKDIYDTSNRDMSNRDTNNCEKDINDKSPTRRIIEKSRKKIKEGVMGLMRYLEGILGQRAPFPIIP